MSVPSFMTVSVKFDGLTAIDIYINKSINRKNILIFSFGNLADGGANSTGYAGDFLLENGYSIVAFKASRKQNIWFQDLNFSAFSEIEKNLESLSIQHWKRIGYGSSMGGFGAIAFSKSLRLNSVLAYSPQFDIRQDWDKRWADYVDQITFTTEICRQTVNPEATIAVACDPFDPDYLHLKQLAKVVSSEKLKPILFPFAGHPVGHFLKEVRYLKKMALGFFDEGVTSSYISKEHARTSFTRGQTLAEVCIRRKKYYSALRVLNWMQSALKIDQDQRALIFDLISKAYENLGQHQLMMNYTCLALEESPNNKRISIRWAELSMSHANLTDFVGRLSLLRKEGVVNTGLTKRHFKALQKLDNFEGCKDLFNSLRESEKTPELILLAVSIYLAFKKYAEVINICQDIPYANTNEKLKKMFDEAKRKNDFQ